MQWLFTVITLYNEIVTLITETFKEDDIGQYIPTENKMEIFCRMESISKNEWFDAGRNGLKPQLKVILPEYNYEATEKVEYDGERYSVYRMFRNQKTNEVELYLEKKAGV